MLNYTRKQLTQVEHILTDISQAPSSQKESYSNFAFWQLLPLLQCEPSLSGSSFTKALISGLSELTADSQQQIITQIVSLLRKDYEDMELIKCMRQSQTIISGSLILALCWNVRTEKEHHKQIIRMVGLVMDCFPGEVMMGSGKGIVRKWGRYLENLKVEREIQCKIAREVVEEKGNQQLNTIAKDYFIPL